MTILLLLAAPPAAQQIGPGPRDVVQSAERAAQDDSVATVRARWAEALRRDSTDRIAARGRDLVYDRGVLALGTGRLDAAERLFGGFPGEDRGGGQARPPCARVGLAEVAARHAYEAARP